MVFFFFYIWSSNNFSNLHPILAGWVSSTAHDKCLVCSWCFFKPKNFSSYTKIYKTLHVVVSFTTQLTYLHHNVKFIFSLMCHTFLVPHLLKTTRNCIYFSGKRVGDVHTRCMWNDDKHITMTKKEPCNTCQKSLLTSWNSSFGKMKVSLPIQVLIKSMANALEYFHPNGEAEELARFICIVNDFFNMANTRLVKEHIY